jgi:hypothetical protein
MADLDSLLCDPLPPPLPVPVLVPLFRGVFAGVSGAEMPLTEKEEESVAL